MSNEACQQAKHIHLNRLYRYDIVETISVTSDARSQNCVLLEGGQRAGGACHRQGHIYIYMYI